MIDFLILGILLVALIAIQRIVATKALALTPQGRCKKAMTAQDFLGFKDISDNMIIIDEYRYRGILQIQPINFFLKSTVEQQAIENAFKNSLDSLRFPIEIFIPSMRLDANENLSQMESHLERANPLLQAYGRNLVDFTQNWVAHKSLLTKGFYLILSYDFLDDKGLEGRDEKLRYQQAAGELENRCFRLVEELATCGLKSKMLGTPAIKEFIFKVYNRERPATVNRLSDDTNGFFSLYTTAYGGVNEDYVRTTPNC